MTTIRSQSELYELYKNEVQNQKPELTDFEAGAINDVLGGAVSFAVSEATKLIVDEFKKTFFDTADGPEITGDSDDLQTLAVDHFGPDFARPGATYAEGVVTFSRSSAGAGNVVIPAGTIVKTALNANGESIRFSTILQVTMTSLSVNASVKALVAGVAGNVDASSVQIIETSLTDNTVTVSNAAAMSGGAAILNDTEYRARITNLITQLPGATKAAIRAKAFTVPGIETATIIENPRTVIEYDTANSLTVGTPFTIPDSKLYIADANGNAAQTLIDAVNIAVNKVRACGVMIEVVAATGFSIDWTVSLTLNPFGPSYATLASNPLPILDSMSNYINDLPVGNGFSRTLAKAAILAIWGPSGTNDLTDFATVAPSGDIAASPSQKLVAGNMETF